MDPGNPNDKDMAHRPLLRHLLSIIPQQKPKFILRHPDSNLQNFIVAEDGSLLSIIDWDGVCIEPAWAGTKCFPMFLTQVFRVSSIECKCGGTHDWCRMVMRKNEQASKLPKYRDMYLSSLKDCEGSVEDAFSSTGIIRNSMLARKLAVTATIPDYTQEVLVTVIADIRNATIDDPRCPKYEILPQEDLGERDSFDAHLVLQIGKDLAAGTLSEERMEWLQDRFLQLWAS